MVSKTAHCLCTQLAFLYSPVPPLPRHCIVCLFVCHTWFVDKSSPLPCDWPPEKSFRPWLLTLGCLDVPAIVNVKLLLSVSPTLLLLEAASQMGGHFPALPTHPGTVFYFIKFVFKQKG